MKSSDIQKKYKKQKKLLFKYNHHYFNLDSPLISDSKYDQINSSPLLSASHLNRLIFSLAQAGLEPATLGL